MNFILTVVEKIENTLIHCFFNPSQSFGAVL